MQRHHDTQNNNLAFAIIGGVCLVLGLYLLRDIAVGILLTMVGFTLLSRYRK